MKALTKSLFKKFEDQKFDLIDKNLHIQELIVSLEDCLWNAKQISEEIIYENSKARILFEKFKDENALAFITKNENYLTTFREYEDFLKDRLNELEWKEEQNSNEINRLESILKR